MDLTLDGMEKGIAICGLVCSLCSYNKNCAGCREKDGDCSVKKCCLDKGLNHCFECDEYPCNEDMHKGIRSRAFNNVAKQEGIHELAKYLYRNYQNGISYHREDGLVGDYDKLQNEQEIIDLLKNRK